MIQGITNPALLLGTSFTDLRTGRTDNGQLVPYGGIVLPFRANAAIVAGQALTFVVPTTGVNGTGLPLSVKPWAITDPLWLFAGIAVSPAATGVLVPVCILGHCLALVNVATTVTIGDRIVTEPTNAGVVTSTAVAVAATDLNDNSLGIALGAKDANNLVSIWLHVK